MTRREFRGLARELRIQPSDRRRSVIVRLINFGVRHLPEIVVMWLVVRGWQAATDRIGATRTELFSGGLAVGLVSWPRTRRGLVAIGGCLLTRARLRSAFRELRLRRRTGRLPFILALWPTSAGERIWLCCPVGVSAEDIADETERLRAACFAREVRVTRDRRFSALVTVDVVRRDLLAVPEKVESSFGWIASVRHHRHER